MPGFDGTGPRGFGPRTGGGFGYCGPGAGPGRYVPGAVYGVGRGGLPWGGGRGRAFGGGRGRGWRRRFPFGGVPYWPGLAQPYGGPADERAFLESELASLEQQLTAVRDRLAEMETETSQE